MRISNVNGPRASRDRGQIVTRFSRREITLAFASVPLQKRHHHHHDPTSKPSSESGPQDDVLGLSQADKAKESSRAEIRQELSQEQIDRSQQWQREFIETASGLE